MSTSRNLLLAGCYLALLATLLASSGLTSPDSSHLLLAFGAIFALNLSRAPRRLD